MALTTLSKRQIAKKGLVNPGGKPMSKRQLAKRGYVAKAPAAAAKPVAKAPVSKPVGPPIVPPGQAKREDYARGPYADSFEYRDPGGNLGTKTEL